MPKFSDGAMTADELPAEERARLEKFLEDVAAGDPGALAEAPAFFFAPDLLEETPAGYVAEARAMLEDGFSSEFLAGARAMLAGERQARDSWPRAWPEEAVAEARDWRPSPGDIPPTATRAARRRLEKASRKRNRRFPSESL